MSYILEALRKAEAERASGQVPGLYTPGAPAAALARRSDAGGLSASRLVLGALGGLALVGLVMGGASWWRWVASPPSTALPAAGSAPAPSSALGAAFPSPEGPVAAVRPLVVATPAPVAQPSPVPVAPPAVVAPAPAAVAGVAVASPGPLPAAAGRSAPPAAAPAAGPAPVAAVATRGPASSGASAVETPPAAATPPADGRPVPLADLPEALRREWPALQFGGLIQLDDPPRRSLIVNGAIVMEGEAVQSGLVLERVRDGSALLRWRGWLVQTPY